MLTPIELVQQVLSDAVDYPVVSKVPNPRPEVFVRVDQSAPQVLSPVHQRAQVYIQAYAPTRAQAVDVALEVREHLVNAEVIHPKCFGVGEVTGPVEFADPDLVDVSRWQVTGIVYMATR